MASERRTNKSKDIVSAIYKIAEDQNIYLTEEQLRSLYTKIRTNPSAKSVSVDGITLKLPEGVDESFSLKGYINNQVDPDKLFNNWLNDWDKDYISSDVLNRISAHETEGAGISDDSKLDSVQDDAFNSYYRDAYNLDDPYSSASQMYGTMTENQQALAQEQARIADISAQQQAMQQASAIKAITDQVRAERMSRLRAGMSESQIANQDMQTMMANVNTLNQQANQLNANQLNAQAAYNTAQQDAYNSWLQQANAQATAGSAYAAADAGDAMIQAQKYAKKTGKSISASYPIVTGQTKTN